MRCTGMGLYFLASLIAVGWLFIWVVRADNDPEKYRDKSPFAIRDSEEIAKVHGKRAPF